MTIEICNQPLGPICIRPKGHTGDHVPSARAVDKQANDQLDSQQERRWKRYMKMPEPRPDYFEWAAAYSRREEFDDTERIARTATRMGDRLKAKELLLRFGKTLPKQQVEVTSKGQVDKPLDPAHLLDLALETNGIPKDKFEDFLKTVRS